MPKTKWRSGYHICFTRRRSPIIGWNHTLENVAGNYFSCRNRIRFYNWKLTGFVKISNIQLYSGYHMCLPHINSQVAMRVETYYFKHLHCFQANTKCKFDITTKLNGIVQLSMIPWCSNYHICFIRKRNLLFRSIVESNYSKQIHSFHAETN